MKIIVIIIIFLNFNKLPVFVSESNGFFSAKKKKKPFDLAENQAEPFRSVNLIVNIFKKKKRIRERERERKNSETLSLSKFIFLFLRSDLSLSVSCISILFGLKYLDPI